MRVSRLSLQSFRGVRPAITLLEPLGKAIPPLEEEFKPLFALTKEPAQKVQAKGRTRPR